MNGRLRREIRKRGTVIPLAMAHSNLVELKAAAAKLKGTWFNRLSKSVLGIGVEMTCMLSSIAYIYGAAWLTLNGPAAAMRHAEVYTGENTWTAFFVVDANKAVGLMIAISFLVMGSILLFGFARYLASVSEERRLALELCDSIEKLREPGAKQQSPSA